MQYRLHCQEKYIDKFAKLLNGEKVMGVILVQVNDLKDLEKMADAIDCGITMSNRVHDLWVQDRDIDF
jgi:hypothetical protein